jgi:mono/diheme cytochrome c family protein
MRQAAVVALVIGVMSVGGAAAETRGFYLATIGHCLECHTPFAAAGPVDFKNALGNGERKFPGP